MLAVVGECGADPRQIEIEVTESVLLDDDDLVREALGKLRAGSLRVALDDFGTGYSSLSYLQRFQVDKIKIDRSFVQPLFKEANAAPIVSAVIALGRAIGLQITAEGVEIREQQEFLAAAGCHMAQGYLYSPAVPEAEIDKLIAPVRSARKVA
jgi:EAL domain-containing protein (putative c-di-GMP-specific phosphodiesterase class I)